jgi:hypothetical protein
MEKKDLSYIPKDREELSKIVENSLIVFDVNDANQSGLTLRTLDTVCMGKKLITTNMNVKDYDFYSPANIYVMIESPKVAV